MTYCLGFLFSHGMKQVVLLRKVNPSWQRGKFNGVGGKIEEGESPEGAMYREFYEEMGQNSPSPWVPYGQLKCHTGATVYLFYSELPAYENVALFIESPLTKEANRQTGEHASWFNVAVLPSMFRELSFGWRVADFIPNIPCLVFMAIGMRYGDSTKFYVIQEQT